MKFKKIKENLHNLLKSSKIRQTPESKTPSKKEKTRNHKYIQNESLASQSINLKQKDKFKWENGIKLEPNCKKRQASEVLKKIRETDLDMARNVLLL